MKPLNGFSDSNRPTIYLIQLSLLFVLYSLAQSMGSSFTIYTYSLIGVALPSLYFFGLRFWPLVFFISFFMSHLSMIPNSYTLDLAIGDTLGSMVGAWLLQRFEFRPSLESAKDVQKMFLLAAVIAPLFGTLAGMSVDFFINENDNIRVSVFSARWLNDAVSIMVFGSFFFVWNTSGTGPKIKPSILLEVLLLTACALLINSDIFPEVRLADFTIFQHTYFIFPLLLWAAVRFWQKGVTAITLLVFILAIVGLSDINGLFTAGTMRESITFLQLFLLVGSFTGIFLASTIVERMQKERRLKVQNAVMEILANASSIEEAAPRLLDEMAIGYGLDVGDFWINDEEQEKLTPLCARSLGSKAKNFTEDFLLRSFNYGMGMPGKVLTTGVPEWFTNVASRHDFSRRDVARSSGLHGAIAFPVTSGKRKLGVLEFFSHDHLANDRELLDCIASHGSQIGQFMESKIAQEALLQSKRELESKVLKRTEELQKLYKSEQESRVRAQNEARMREELVAMVSHDLKNPLSVILAIVEQLKKELTDKDPKWILMVERSAISMNEMITNLLDLHKMEAGHFNINPVPCIVSEFVSDVIESQRPLADKKGISLEAEMREGLPLINIDRQQLLRVFQNIIGNALKFTPSGGLIRLQVFPEGDQVQFSIQDNGPGIDKETLSKIFEPFVQADQAKGLGTGLGLAIANGIVLAHRGKIWAQSELNKGSTFYFTVPGI